MDNEIWKDIKNYEGLYQISNLGRIKSLSFRNGMTQKQREKILKLYTNTKNGYQYVSLSKNNKRTSLRVHCLLMEVFNPVEKKRGYDKNYTINHINGIKTDNRLENLEWCSQSKNQIHAFETGLNGKNTKKVIRLNDNKIYESITDCMKEHNATRSSAITRVCKGERSNYKGNRFAYYDDFKNNTIPKFKGRWIKNGGLIWE